MFFLADAIILQSHIAISCPPCVAKSSTRLHPPAQLIDDMDLMEAYRTGKVEVVNNCISREAFDCWVADFVRNYNEGGTDHLEGAQEEHE